MEKTMNNIPCEDAIAAMQRKAVRDSAQANMLSILSDIRNVRNIADAIEFISGKYEKRAGS